MRRNYLKKSNIPTIVILLVINIAIFIVISNGISDFWGNIHQKIVELNAKDSLFCFLTPLILSIACGLIPPSWKAVLVFWRVKNPLPGCRAFSHLAKSDPRINSNLLETEISQLPEDPNEQNSKWYQLYKVVQDEVIVQEAHKSFLLNRDLTGISVLFLLFGTPALIPSGASSANIVIYAAILTLEFIAFSITARNHGERFVCNVILEYLHRK